MSLVETVNAKRVFASIEYEVDELRRDLEILALAKAAKVNVTLVHDRCIVEPGVIFTGGQFIVVLFRFLSLKLCASADKTYTMYSPYQRNWIGKLNGNIPYYLENCEPPKHNADGVHESTTISPLFDTPISTLR